MWAHHSFSLEGRCALAYNTCNKSLKQTPLLLPFLENYWDLLFVLTVMCPLPPHCWATRILKHWDRCNAQINIGERETHASVSRFLTRILDLVKPNLNRKMVNQQHQQSIGAANEKGRQRCQLEVGDSVMSRDYQGDLKWRSGLIVNKTGPLM